MEETPVDNPEKLLHKLFIGLCISFHKSAALFWFTLIWGIVQSILGALLLIPLPWTPDDPHVKGTLLELLLRYAPTMLPYGLCLLLWTALASVASHLEVGFSEKELKRRYLRRIIREKEQFGIIGLPANLTVQRVLLEDIVFPLYFRLDEPLTDYPLTKVELGYYEGRLRQRVLTKEERRLLYSSNTESWLNQSNQNTITMADLWNSLSQKEPVAIIQGFPGMGKSTLLRYLMLYLARCQLRLFYKHGLMPKLRPKLLPIFINLGSYAKVYSENPNNPISLRTYLTRTLEELRIAGITQFIINDHLRTGRCLVLLDGLDEVESKDIQKAIVAFIREYSDTYENTRNFNRFFITSRVAPHSRTHSHIIEDIAGYQCYTIAELTTRQIEEFWSLWFLANKPPDTVSGINRLFGSRKATDKEILEKAKNFYTTIKDQVEDLMERPLLLALVAAMQHKPMFPRKQIELYSIIMHIMLEARRDAHGHPAVSETEVIKYLGPLAFQMQEKGIRTIHYDEVITSFKESLNVEGHADVNTQEAQDFLDRFRFQGGFFIQRAGKYFGFFCYIFQKYVTARYIFDKIQHGSDSEVKELVTRIYLNDDLREPLFLAVSYKSSEDSTISKKLIQSLLATPQPPLSSMRSQGYQVVLGARCLLEAEALITDPNHNDPDLDTSIAERLLNVYKEAREQRLTNTSKEIEEIICLWLQKLPRDVHPSFPLLAVLREAIRDTNDPVRQCAVLALLTATAECLLSCTCALAILNELVPLLLALAGLPHIGKYQPATNLAATPNAEVAKLVKTNLLLIGQQESIGLSLTEMNLHFESQSNVLLPSDALSSKDSNPTVQ